jgi:hypothetical protein
MADDHDDDASGPEAFQRLNDRAGEILRRPQREHDDLIRKLVRDFKKTEPDVLKTIAEWGRGGLFLGEAFGCALGAALSRLDLDDDQKLDVLSDAGDFFAAMDVVRSARHGLVSRDIVMRMAMAALFVGLRAGLNSNEIEALERNRLRAAQSERGKLSAEARRKASEPWRIHAAEIAKHARSHEPNLSQERVADAIMERWKEGFPHPGHRQLVKFVGELEKAGEVPRRTGSVRK